MYRIVTSLDDLERVIPDFEHASPLADVAAQKEVLMLGGDILVLMEQPGLEIAYPVQWDSEKQRRAYFATDGFGHGIPYTRTQGYQSAWERVPLQDGVIVQNKDPKSIFVGGTLKGGETPATGGQSRIHKARWPAFHDAATSVLTRWSEGGWAKIRLAWLEAFMKDFRKK